MTTEAIILAGGDGTRLRWGGDIRPARGPGRYRR
jgi:hypothetical protein